LKRFSSGIMLTMLLTSLFVLNFSAINAPSSTEIYVQPAYNTFYTSNTPLGSRFNVTVWVKDVIDLFAFQVYLTVNDTVLNITRAWHPTWDPIWVFYGRTTVRPSPAFYDNDEDGSKEAVLINDVILPPSLRFNGTGKLCIIEFKIITMPLEGGEFSSVLNINYADTLLLDFDLNEISAIKTNGNYRIVYGLPTYYIRADGSIDPAIAPIQRNGDLYTLTDNIYAGIFGIVIERNNIILDGAGYTVQGIGAVYSKGIYLTSRSNVTIKNINVKGFHFGFVLISSSYSAILRNIIASNSYGIWLNSSSNYNTIKENKITATVQTGISLYDSSNCSIAENGITNNWGGIGLYGSSKSSVVGNNITSNQWGIGFSVSSNNNTIFHNNFVNNTKQVWPPTAYSPKNVWDAGYPSGGNYWSNYNGTDSYRGVYQNETGSDGIGDIPYIIDDNNRDRYPLKGPFGTSTGVGENVTVFPSADVGLIFQNVAAGGSTTVERSATGPVQPPSGELVGQYYEIETTADYSGKISVRIIYDDTNMTLETERSLQLLQWNSTLARMYGDITGPISGIQDGKVDIRDIAMIARLFGVNYPDPRYNPICDITGSTQYVPDGKIDIRDIALAAVNFGKTINAWVNITVYIDTENNIIYGETTHLSIFGVHRFG